MRPQMSSYDRARRRVPTPRMGSELTPAGNSGHAPPGTLVWPARCDCEAAHIHKDFFTVEDQWFNAIGEAKLIGR